MRDRERETVREREIARDRERELLDALSILKAKVSPETSLLHPPRSFLA